MYIFWPCGHQATEVWGSNLGSCSLLVCVVHIQRFMSRAGTDAYAFLNLCQTIRTGFSGARTCSASQCWDNVVHGLRETQWAGIIRKIISTWLFSLLCPSLAHTTHSLPAKVAVAAHHLHLDTLPTLPSLSGMACTMGHHWIGLSISRGESRPQKPK